MKSVYLLAGILVASVLSACADTTGPADQPNPYGPSVSSQASMPNASSGLEKAHAMMSPVTNY